MSVEASSNNYSDLSMRQALLIGGFSLLAIAILAPVGYIGIIGNIIDPGDALSTIANMRASSWRLSIGILLLLVNAILDLVGAWALYVVFQQVNRSISLLSAWFRLGYTVILIIALGSLLGASQLLGGLENSTDPNVSHLSTLLMSNIGQFYNLWDLGYSLFGFHLILLGYLIIRSMYFPVYLGVLVGIAGIGYLADHLLILALPEYDLKLSMYTFVGEVFLFVYLLIRGFRGFRQC